jgi:peptidoglycan/xylan/chitin deacetylase (PgdA/CDA1 family)
MQANRRQFVTTVAGAGAWLATRGFSQAASSQDKSAKAQIAVTLDLEMARNFPRWEDTHWDYEKGNLNQAAKDYAVAVCRRVKKRRGRVHTFVVGRTLEQENVDWLKEIAAEGHPIGNHTYDHVYLLATKSEEIQYRFARSPWLIRGRPVADVIRENIELTNRALKERIGVEANGFRTPGGFATALNGRDDLQKMLLGLGFDWVSSKYTAHAGIEDLHGTDKPPSDVAYANILAAQNESQPFLYPTGLLEVPMSPISDVGAFRNGRWQVDHLLKAISFAMSWVIEHHAVFDFLSHPSVLGVMDPDFRVVDHICDLVEQSNGKAEIVTLDVIAKRARKTLAARDGNPF